jgi:DNA-binding LytR/AlgR family response regulator
MIGGGNMNAAYYMTVYAMEANGNKIFTVIDMDDIDYIENDGRRAVFHVGNEQFYMITNKSELEELLEERGFDALDRANLVNIKRVHSFNRDYGKVFFTENPDKNSKYATVARIKYSFIEKFLHRAIANNKGTQIEQNQEKSKTSIVSKLKELF